MTNKLINCTELFKINNSTSSQLLEALDGQQGTVCIADDVTIHEKVLEEPEHNLLALMKRCRDTGVAHREVVVVHEQSDLHRAWDHKT